MGDPMPEDEDRRLATMFRAAATPVADDGFSEAVMRRVSRHAWRRRALLAIAGAAGLAVAARPVWNISVALGQELAHLGHRWTDFAWVLQSPIAIAAGILVIVGPPLWQWLEE